MNISDLKVENHLMMLEKELKENNMFSSYDHIMIIRQAIVERNRKIKGLEQHNKNMEYKLERISCYKYGKQY